MLENSFLTIFLTAEAWLAHCLSAAAVIFLELWSFMVSSMRLSFITQFKIEFLLPFTGCRKVLGKMPVYINIFASTCIKNV